MKDQGRYHWSNTAKPGKKKKDLNMPSATPKIHLKQDA